MTIAIGVMRETEAGEALPLPEDSTRDLLARLKSGDAEARERLCARYLPLMRRWARGRLPLQARDQVDTDDLVQDSMLRTLDHLDDFEARGQGALGAYLRQVILNRLRDEARRVSRRPERSEPAALDDAPSREPSPFEEALGHETVERYESALARLRPLEREVILARLELDCGYAELAAILGKPSADAARVAVSRALVRLAQEMGDVGRRS
jgi:RNA polymerase sigma factor (sigma-70 family)